MALQPCMLDDDDVSATRDEFAPDKPADSDEVMTTTRNDSGATMPVSSFTDKLKGFAAIFVLLLASGFVLNFSFSPASPLLANQEPQVNAGMVKYAGVTSKATSD